GGFYFCSRKGTASGEVPARIGEYALLGVIRTARKTVRCEGPEPEGAEEMGHGRSVDDRFTVFELGEGIARGSERSRSGRALLVFRSVEGERRIGIRSTRRPGDAERHYQLYSEEFSWRRRVLVSRDQIKKEEDRCSESRLDAGRVTDGSAAAILNSAILSNIAKRGSRCVLDPAVRKDEPKRPATCVFDGSATLKKSDRAMR